MVYAVHETRTGKTYACKVVSKSSLAKERARKKMQTEIRIHRAVDCAHVVKFVRCFDDDANVYIIMELCSNKTLSDVVKTRGKLTEDEAAPYLREVVAAGHHLHAMKVIHRDLKLGNLFLTQRGWEEVTNAEFGPGKDPTLGVFHDDASDESCSRDSRLKIGDFGLACALEHGVRRKTICGTPNYIAPEVLEGSKGMGHSYEVDTWSFGVILYTLLFGSPPFQTKEIKQTYKRIRAGDYSFPPDVVVEESTKELIRAALHPDPGHRPSFQEIASHPLLKRGASDWTLSDVKPTPYTPRAPESPTPKSRKVVESSSANGDVDVDVGARSPLRAVDNGARSAAPKTPLRVPVGSPKTKAVSTKKLPVLEDVLNSRSPSYARERNASNELALASRGGGGDASRIADEFDSLRLARSPPKVTIADFPHLWVKQWWDFTSKFGVGYVLSDGSVGVIFNDRSRLVFESPTVVAYRVAPDIPAIERGASAPETVRLDIERDTPPDRDVNKKITIASSFRSRLLADADAKPIETSRGGLSAALSLSHTVAPYATTSDEEGAPYVKDCFRTSKGVFWRLSNRTVQCNFVDGSEILLATASRLVVFTDASGKQGAHALEDRAFETDHDLRRAMRWTKDMITVATTRRAR